MSKYRFAERVRPITGSAIREIFNMLADPNIISFAGGNPSPASFPSAKIKQIVIELMELNGEKILQYGSTEGWGPLRETAMAINSKKGINSALSNIQILTGSSQGIELSAKLFLNEGDTLLLEDPTFLGATQTFRTYKAEPLGVDTDAEGMILSDLEEKIKIFDPKLIYTIPNFQNPSGNTTSLARRKGVFALADKYKVVIVEDDPYGELRYEGDDIPCIKTFDSNGERVILLNSFSKTISPGLRVGYATADPEIIRKMAVIKQGIDIHTTNLSQAIVDAFYRKGLYYPHVQRICEFYRVQRDAMLDAIAKYFPKNIKYTRPEGGLFIWIELSKNIQVLPIFKEAVARGVAFVPGEHFYADLSGKNTLRLNFSMPSVEQIDIGCKILGELLHETLADC